MSTEQKVNVQATQTQQQTQTQQSTKQQTEVVIVEGQLRKIIHQEGEGECPKKGQQIYALYRGTLLDGTQFDANQDRDDPFKFNLGEGRVIKGWDQGFATMKRGERATLICSPDYAYGKRGSPPRIPPNSTLKFQVELLDFKEKIKEKWDLSDEQKIEEATQAKNQGNEAFKRADFKQAAKLYKKGIEFIEEDQSGAGQQILKVLRLNIAQAQLKTGQNSEAITNCTKVLEKDANNLKALYRRGLAYLKNQDFSKATIDFESLLKIEPGNADAQKQLQNVKIAERAQKQKQKKVFGNMFAKAGVYSEQTKKATQPAKQETSATEQLGSEQQAEDKKQQ